MVHSSVDLVVVVKIASFAGNFHNPRSKSLLYQSKKKVFLSSGTTKQNMALIILIWIRTFSALRLSNLP